MWMKKNWKCWIWGAVAFVCMVGWSGCSNNSDPDQPPRHDQGQASDVTEFYTAAIAGGDLLESQYTEAADSAAPPEKNADERTIEEADIIRIEGSYLYILNQYKGLTICDIAQPDAPRLRGRAAVSGYPIDMYIRDQRAFILVVEPMSYYGDVETSADGADSAQTFSRVDVINIASADSPVLAGSYRINGRVTDSRIVGDILYVVSAEEPNYWFYAARGDSPDKDALTAQDNQRNVYVASIDISAPAAMNLKHRVDFGGNAEYIHVTAQAIFIAASVYDGVGQKTNIAYIDISDPQGMIRQRGDIQLPGQMTDKFKFDYFNGYLRVCTYIWENNGISNLFVVDVSQPDRLNRAAAIELGKGEQLFATRFDGDRAYLVTYERKDPLWVIDLSEPTQPEIRGELIVPGWSTHIEPRGDHLVALGVDDTDGNKVAVSLFDVADPKSPTLIKRLSFGDAAGWSSSAAYYDVKAFTVIDDLGLILLPYSAAISAQGNYKIENRLQLIDYTPRDLTARGWVSQKGDILRSRTHANRIFSVSGEELQVIDASDRDRPHVTARLTLALNISNFFPLANGYGVQLVESSGQYQLRCVSLTNPAEGEPISELSLEGSSYPRLFANGNFLYVLTSVNPVYAYNHSNGQDQVRVMPYPLAFATQITVYDFSSPAHPQKRGTVEVPGEFYTLVRAEESLLSCPFYMTNMALQVKADLLTFIIRPQYWGPYPAPALEPETDKPIPDALPEQFEGFIQVDLSNPDKPVIASQYAAKLSLAEGFFVNNGKVCYSVYEEAEPDDQHRGLLKYYLARLNLANPAEPVLMKAVNVPGTVLGLDVAGKYAYSLNREWVNQEQYHNTLNIVELKDDLAALAGSVALGVEYQLFLVEDGLIYAAGYSYRGGSLPMIVADMSHPQRPQLHQNVFAANDFGLIGAKGRKAFVSRPDGIACYMLTNPAIPALSAFIPGVSWANGLTYSATKAYISQGYYGLWELNL